MAVTCALSLLFIFICHVGISTSSSGSVFFIAGGHPTHTDIELFHPTITNLKCSITPPALKVSWERHTSFVHDRSIYLCGGDGGFTADKCISYNNKMKDWKTHTMSIKRDTASSSVVLRNTVYLIGGRSGSKYLGVHSTSLPLTNQPVLSLVPKLSYQGYAQCTAKIDEDTLVIIGGHDGSSYLSTVLQYNTKTSTTTSLPSLTTARAYHGCVVTEMEKKTWLIVVGGSTAGTSYLQTTEMMKLEGGKWTRVTGLGNLNSERYGSSMIAKGNKIMVLGGRDTNIEVLDWSTKLFKEVKQGLKKGRDQFGGAVEIPASLFNCPEAMQTPTTQAAPTCAPTPTCPTMPEPATCPMCPIKTCAPTPTCSTMPEPPTCPPTPTCPTMPEPSTCPTMPEPPTCPPTPTCPKMPEPPTCPSTPTCPTMPEPSTCPPTPTCPTESGSIMTTTQMADSCDDIGCKNAFNGLGICVDTTSADFIGVSKTIDFAAGTKAGKCSKDCNCNCFKHTGCYSDKCDAKQGICLIPEQAENRGFFIPNEYKKAFPCDKSLNCFCYIKNYIGVTTPSAVTGVTKPRSTPTCKPNKKCTKKRGQCFGEGDIVPKNAKRKGWCNKKAGCKCYKV